MEQKNRITLIGSGSMGTALARLLLKAGYSLTVWNRTPKKAQQLASEGASHVEDVIEAISAGDFIIVSVSNYESAQQILRTAAVEEAINGKVLIQLSTGTPKEAVEEQQWADARNISYLDGAIMVTPQQMGTSEAMLLVSGATNAYRKAEMILKTLAPHVRYMGPKANAASATDLALLSYFFSAIMGFVHAAHIFKAEGLDVLQLGDLISGWSPAVGTIMKECGDRIEKNDFSEPQGSVQTCYLSLELVLRQAREAQMTTAVPQWLTAVFKKAMEKGLGEEDGSAIYKVL